MGISNGVGTLSGMVCPLIVGAMTKHKVMVSFWAVRVRGLRYCTNLWFQSPTPTCTCLSLTLAESFELIFLSLFLHLSNPAPLFLPPSLPSILPSFTSPPPLPPPSSLIYCFLMATGLVNFDSMFHFLNWQNKRCVCSGDKYQKDCLETGRNWGNQLRMNKLLKIVL